MTTSKPETVQESTSHDWDDQDKCRRCGDRDWYASATCTPKKQPAPDMPVLAEALRQYRHNDGSGLVFGYDLETTQRVVAQLVEALEAVMEFGCDPKSNRGKWAREKAESVLAVYRKGGTP